MALLRQCLQEVRCAAAARESLQSRRGGATVSPLLLTLRDPWAGVWQPMPFPEPGSHAAAPTHASRGS